MAIGQGEKVTRTRRVRAVVAERNQDTAKNESYNEARRKLYATDVEYAAAKRKQTLDHYHKTKGTPQRAQRGTNLLSGGSLREVYFPGSKTPVCEETYTMDELAVALGRSPATIKRWVQEDLFPLPVVMGSARTFARYYTPDEARVFSEVLAEHERSFSNYGVNHPHTRERLMQAIHGIRATTFLENG